MLAVAALMALAPTAPPPSVDSCSAIATDLVRQVASVPLAVSHFKGMNSVSLNAYRTKEGFIVGVACERRSLIPESSDWIMLDRGLWLRINVGGRTLLVERVHGEPEARMLKGVLSGAERSLVKSWLRESSQHFRPWDCDAKNSDSASTARKRLSMHEVATVAMKTARNNRYDMRRFYLDSACYSASRSEWSVLFFGRNEGYEIAVGNEFLVSLDDKTLATNLMRGE